MVDDLVFDTLSYKRNIHYTHILIIRGSDIILSLRIIAGPLCLVHLYKDHEMSPHTSQNHDSDILIISFNFTEYNRTRAVNTGDFTHEKMSSAFASVCSGFWMRSSLTPMKIR